MGWLLAWGVGLVLLVVSPGVAQVSVRLPLEGYCRVGRYVPVEVAGRTPAGEELAIQVEGAMATILAVPSGAVEATVPLLVLRGPGGEVRWSVGGREGEQGGPQLRVLADDERLVAMTNEGVGVAQGLFPQSRIVPVRLEPGRVLAGPAAAWGTLDALVLSGAELARMDAQRREQLLAAGVMLVVRSNTVPDAQWPWEQVGEYWMLARGLAGPEGAQVNDLAYLPTYGWVVGWPAELRRALVLAAGGFCLIVMLIGLLRRRLAVPLTVVVVACMVAVVAYWRAVQSPLLHAQGDVVVRDKRIAQQDRWSYQTTMDQIDSGFRWEGLTYPQFASQRQEQAMGMALRCDAHGGPVALTYHLPPGMRVAFVTRTLRAEPVGAAVESALTSPLATMARELYVPSGARIVGQMAAPQTGERSGGVTWPGVMLEMPARSER